VILFQNDWATENANIHYDTNNKSFIRAAMVLKRLGIQNYQWPLALYQSELAKYDPHNLKDNSEELRLKIGLECKVNSMYFFREVLRLPSAGGDPIPVNANRGILAMFWCFFNNISYVSIQPRQSGKTIGACAIITWVMYIGGHNIEMSLYTKDSDLVQANVGRIKTMRESLPKYLLFKQPTDTDNKEGLSYSKFENKYLTNIAKPSRQDADNLARGMTSPVLHIDEPGYCTNIDISYPIMMLSTITAIANARAQGQPHSNILTTTAAPIDTKRGKFTFDLVNKAMPFTENLYDLRNNAELKQLVRTNSKNGIINGTFSYQMLGKSREWYEEACRISEAPKDVNDRELLNMWTSGSESSLLDAEIIRIINANRHEPEHTEIISDYVVKWYIPESVRASNQFKQRRSILGMDSSENIGEDFTTLVLIDVTDMSVICTFRCNESNTIKLGMFIAEFLMMYPGVTFIPERNSTGGAIIDVITLVFQKHHINPFRRIYNEIVQRRDDPQMGRISLDDPDVIDTTIKKYLGFRTTAKTRPFLYKNTLKKAVALNAVRIHDVTLISELSALAVVNGRIDHAENGHDDMCFIGSTLVRTDKGNRPISELKIGDLVLTRQGYKPILHIFKSEKEVISKFGFTGTENHPFITPIDGIVEFKDLTPETRVYTWNEKQSVITEKTITDILNQTDHNSETIITDTIKTKVHPWHFIGRYMRMLKDLFQKSRTFIMWTKTISTTPSKISNVSRRLSILRNILPLKRHEGSLLNFREKEIHWGCGVENIQKNPAPYVLQTEFVEQENLLPNGESLTQSLHTKQRFVQEAAQNESNHKAVVYNLYIADCHEYFANDVLVHNCIAYLLACWLIFFGENLHYYGIDVRSILMSVTSDGNAIDPEHRDAQLELRRQIKTYEDLLNTTSSILLKNNYRQKILLLQDRLDHTVTVEPIASSKINPDANEYGTTLYTPQEFARTEKKNQVNAGDVFRRAMKMLH
jgi:hypothetical protein